MPLTKGGQMATKIRLARFGAKKAPFYRVVVADSRSPRDGKFIAILGTYDPMAEDKNKAISIDVDATKDWLSKGATPTDTAKALLVRAGAMEKPVYKPKPNAKPPKAKEAKK